MKSSPLVSVIIPTYNREHLLDRAVKSVLNQTYQNFEIIVVDDASTDDTEKVIKRFNDKRIKYIKHKINSGGSAAPRNTGIKAAQGNYIAFQDSDDEWLPEKLEKQMKTFEEFPKTKVVYSGFWRIENGRKEYIPNKNVKKIEGDLHKELLERNFITPQAVIIKKECFDKAGLFEEKLRSYQDWEMWIRVSRKYKFKCINEPLVMSYLTTDSITARRKEDYNALMLILEKHLEYYRKDKGLLSEKYFYLSSLLFANKKYLIGIKYLMESFKLSSVKTLSLLIIGAGIKLKKLLKGNKK